MHQTRLANRLRLLRAYSNADEDHVILDQFPPDQTLLQYHASLIIQDYNDDDDDNGNDDDADSEPMSPLLPIAALAIHAENSHRREVDKENELLLRGKRIKVKLEGHDLLIAFAATFDVTLIWTKIKAKFTKQPVNEATHRLCFQDEEEKDW
jgi:predicted protein tyrosine phosphatase